MALLLSLETSAEVCSVAIHRDGSLVGLKEIHIHQSHASRLMPAIESLLYLAEVGKEQMEGVAVSAGPGSYTGLRIGVSTAKGLCYGLGVPLIGLSTLEIMAAGFAVEANAETLLCPMIDARRDEVYAAVYNWQMEILSPPLPRIVDEKSALELSGGNPFLFFGSGAAKCRSLFEAAGGRFVDGAYPTAALVGTLAEQKFRQGHFDDLASFEPYYLKAFQGRRQV